MKIKSLMINGNILNLLLFIVLCIIILISVIIQTLELEVLKFILTIACLNCFIDNQNIGIYLLFINQLIIFYLLLVKIKTINYLKFTLKNN